MTLQTIIGAAMEVKTMVYVILGGSGAIAGAYVAIIGVYRWVSRHMSASKKHPCTDDIVFKTEDAIVYEKTCTARGIANDQAHDYLKEGIEKAIARSDEQHTELKTDMKAGFGKLETLIIQNGR